MTTPRCAGLISWDAAMLVVFYLLTSVLGGIIGGTLNALASIIGGAGKGAALAACWVG